MLDYSMRELGQIKYDRTCKKGKARCSDASRALAWRLLRLMTLTNSLITLCQERTTCLPGVHLYAQINSAQVATREGGGAPGLF